MTTKRRTKPEGAWEGSEDDFQKEAIKRVRSIAKEAGVDPRAVMHVPNGGHRHPRVAAKMKAMGQVAGYPDIMVFGGFDTMFSDGIGLALELKVWPNKPTDAQLAIHKILGDAGWSVNVCYSMVEVEEVSKYYFGV